MSPLLSIPLGVLPSLFWLWLVHRRDDHEREPLLLIAAASALGVLAAVAVLWLRPGVELALDHVDALADAFVVTALTEESLKLLALLPLCLHRELDEPLDGVVYGVAVAMGFAAVENVRYAELAGTPAVVVQRAFTATLAHACFTGGIGFCCAHAKLGVRGWRRAAWPLVGFAGAVTLHGLYDLLLTGDRALALLSLLVVLPAALLLLRWKIRWARGRSRCFHPDAGGRSGTRDGAA